MFTDKDFTVRWMCDPQKNSVTASVGGILSFFLGFSFIGMIELVYYFTVRILCSLLCLSAHPEEIKPWMAKHETRGTGQHFSRRASTSKSNLNKGRRNRAMEAAGGYRRPHMAHESVHNH
jgi:hypothetical protein